MKKSIPVFSLALTLLSLSAVAYMQWNTTDPDTNIATITELPAASTGAATSVLRYRFGPLLDVELFYNVSSRFNATIAKDRLHGATSIIDIVPREASVALENYHTVAVAVLRDGKEITEEGHGDALNAAQLALLRSVDYSTNIHISSLCMKRKAETGELEHHELVYYITVTPEREAEYQGGRSALIDHLKAGCRDLTAALDKGMVRPGRVHFTVTQSGTIAHVRLASTSGYAALDDKVIRLIATMPQNWTPATNAKGEPVDQEFVFFFGTEGC